MTQAHIKIYLATQRLALVRDGATPVEWAVSTAAKGAGEENGSLQTPRGRHIIHEKIGAGAAENTVFKGRRPTGEIYSEALAKAAPRPDWILTRILWLSGCEDGKNKGGAVDTLQRYIYIHGTPDTTPLGAPGSIGCIRMANRAVMELFDSVEVGTPVEIIE